MGQTVTVESKGGALVHQVSRLMQESIKRPTPGVILVHTGVNNVSKNYLYHNEHHQLCTVAGEIEDLVLKISDYTASFPDIKVILSAITAKRTVVLMPKQEL